MAACASPRDSGGGEEEAWRLRSLLEAGPSTIPDIVGACHAVESICRHLPRAFFRSCLPVLLRRVFGFENLQEAASGLPMTLSGGWLSVLAQQGNDAALGVLVGLLAPGGPLMSSMLAADKENVVRYVFPVERLPEWVRRLLAVEQGISILEQISMLYNNRIKEDAIGGLQVELDVFQYYIFWFAYYAVCKEGSTTTSGKKRPGMSQLRSQIENWAFSIPGLHQSPQQGPSFSPLHPYLQLLQLYLSHFVGPSVFRKVSLSPWQEDDISHADILVRTLVDFWLIDDDPCPFPAAARFQLPLPASLYVPPATELTDAVKLLINYFSALLQHYGTHTQFFSSPDVGSGYRRKAGLLSDLQSSPQPVFPTAAASPYLVSLQRPLYRFFLRAFCSWPVSTPVAKVVPMVDVWLHFLEPWSAVLLVSKGRGVQPGSRVSVDEMTRVFSIYWLDYVLSNYPFYASLALHFFEFASKFLLVDMETIFQLTCKVLNVLSSSDELLGILRGVEAASHALARFGGEHHCLNKPFVDRVPMMLEQLKDWEEGVPDLEQEQGERMLPSHQARSSKLRFFSGSERTAGHILEGMISQAEAELNASSSDRLPMSPKTLQDTKELVKRVFSQDMDAHVSSPRRRQEGATLAAANEEAAAPTNPVGLHRHTWADVKYRGDWMRRPVETHEITWLVRLLVKLSCKLNLWLGLVPGDTTPEEVGVAKVPTAIGGPEVLKPTTKVLRAVWFVVREQLRTRGYRVNLRPLGNWQVIMFSVLVTMVCWVSVKMARLTSALVNA